MNRENPVLVGTLSQFSPVPKCELYSPPGCPGARALQLKGRGGSNLLWGGGVARRGFKQAQIMVRFELVYPG